MCNFKGKHIIIVLFLIITFSSKAIAQLLMSDINTDLSHDIYDMSIEDLMEIDIRTGKPGWFGTQLEQLEFDSYIHGYAVTDYRDHDLNRDRSIDSFDLI